jgi:hypothetical protein
LEEKTNKIWKTFGIFSTFKEADAKRKELIDLHELLKVKRCGKDGSLFKIKLWDPPTPLQGTKKKKSKKKRKEK